MKTKNREKQFRGSKMYKLGGSRDRNFFKNSFMSLVVICFMLLFAGVGVASAAPITFSNITVTAIKDTSVLIHWDTDVPATGQIEYGLDTTYGNLTEEKGLSYWQYFRIATLTENTTYHFRIRAKDIDGKETISGDYTFTTRTPEELEALVRAARSEGDLPKTYYVKPDGNDSNDGLSIETAWQSLIYAIRQLEPGDTLYLLNGTWTNPGRVWFDYRTVSGIPTHPIVMKAYNGTPTLDGAGEKATIEIEKDWIVLEGIKVINGTKVGGILIKGSYVTVENCISGGHNWDGISAGGSYNIVRNCTAYNSDMSGISLSGHDNIAEDCTVYQYPDIEPKCDYAFSSTPGWGSESFYHLTYRNCKAIGRPDAEFGHGFAFTQGHYVDEIVVHHSIADNCTVKYAWAGLECRGDPHDILFHNCLILHTTYGGYVHGTTNLIKNITYNNVRVRGFGSGTGFSFEGNPTDIRVENSIANKCHTGFSIETSNSTIVNCVAANNTDIGAWVRAHVSVKNSIFANNTRGIRSENPSGISYCNFWGNGDNYFDTHPYIKDGELAKIVTGGISEDPLFADPANGDFHLKSQAGRWNGTDWVTDSVTSPCIDAGDPNSSYSNETYPHGQRINMGAYGNTPEASKSPYHRIYLGTEITIHPDLTRSYPLPPKSYYGNLTLDENFSATPTSNPVTINITRFNTSLPQEEILVNFTANTTDGNNVNFTICSLKPNTSYTIKKDGTNFTTKTTNESGCLTFNNSQWTEHTFTIGEHTTPTTTTITSTSTIPGTTTTTSTSTTTTSTSTSTTTTLGTTTTTTIWPCDLPGDYPTCGEVTLEEVVDFINLWAQGEADLEDVVNLINAWAGS